MAGAVAVLPHSRPDLFPNDIPEPPFKALKGIYLVALLVHWENIALACLITNDLSPTLILSTPNSDTLKNLPPISLSQGNEHRSYPPEGPGVQLAGVGNKTASDRWPWDGSPPDCYIPGSNTFEIPPLYPVSASLTLPYRTFSASRYKSLYWPSVAQITPVFPGNFRPHRESAPSLRSNRSNPSILFPPSALTSGALLGKSR